MTLLPIEQQRIGKGVPGGVVVRLPPVCMHPRCAEQMNVERHHVVRRSHLGGPFDAVEIDDIIMPNVVTLCMAHHLEVTDNKSMITYHKGHWAWREGDAEDELEPQPQLFYAEAGAAGMDNEYLDRFRRSLHREDDLKTCPRCQGKGRLPKTPEKKLNAPKRKYKTWSMGIPVDAGENGYEIWKTNLESCTERIQDILGYTDTVPPYYVLIAVCSDWLNTTDKEVTG